MSIESPYGLPLKIVHPGVDPDEWVEDDQPPTPDEE